MADVELTVKGQGSDSPIACTLGTGDIPGRIAEWREALRSVTGREPIPGGLRLSLDAGAPVAHIAELAMAEQRCCAFFGFTLTMDARGAALEVTAPLEAAPLIADLFGGHPTG